MGLLWITLAILSLTFLAKAELLTPQTNASVTTVTLLKKYGYDCEEHEVQTADGYLITMHRIVNPAASNSTEPRPLAFAMPGLSASSSDFIVTGTNNSLVIQLDKNGYDVWLGNARGSTYGQKHIKFSPEGLRFWNFSFHEISLYDLPAMLDYISNHTGVQKFRYFAHSQGTTNLFVLTSVKPEWNERFISIHLLAPVAFMSHLTNKLLHLMAPIAGQPNALKEVLGSMEFKPSRETVVILSKLLLCNDSMANGILCKNSLFLTTGFNQDTVDWNFIDDIMATTPSAVSANQYVHYIQEFVSAHFRQYDYGVRNLLEYGRLSPPDYKLENVKGPIFFYFGRADEYVSEIDLNILIEKLPNSTVAGVYTVPVENFDHLAFLYAENIREKVYNKVLEDVKSITS